MLICGHPDDCFSFPSQYLLLSSRNTLADRWNLSLIGLFSFVSSFVNSSDFLRSCVLCSAPFPLRLELSYVRSLLFSASLFLSFYLMSEQSSTLIPLFTLSHRPLVPLSVPPSLLPSPRFLITLPRSMGLSLPPAGVTTGGTCVRSTSIDLFQLTYAPGKPGLYLPPTPACASMTS